MQAVSSHRAGGSTHPSAISSRPFDSGPGMRWGILWAIGGVLLGGAWSPQVHAQDLKIGYVDIGKLFDGYERTKASDTTLEKQSKQKEAELEGRMSELNKLRQSLELLNDQAREAKSKEVEEKADELQRFRTGAARDLRRERDKIARSILEDIQKGVTEYAKSNSFAFILDKRFVLYGQPVSDVTSEVLDLLNDRLKNKGGQ
ncbi:MAG: OmpH family outer membrane protein [Candidatus Omnitrophica bacterium]|nr:OmpH family outer membrane protein [Candidatus Omnitrophota bacterium]